MPPTWYQFNFPKQVTLEGHRQENMSYNFSTGHFIVIFFPHEKVPKEGTFLYTVYSLVLSTHLKNKLKTLKRKEKKLSSALGGKKNLNASAARK